MQLDVQIKSEPDTVLPPTFSILLKQTHITGFRKLSETVHHSANLQYLKN